MVVLQSITGVGVLVIGTPMLLLFNLNLFEILSVLLPISIITGLSSFNWNSSRFIQFGWIFFVFIFDVLLKQKSIKIQLNIFLFFFSFISILDVHLYFLFKN